MCEHLLALDEELRDWGIDELLRGQPWSKNCREWVYYNCIFDLDKVMERYQFPDFVVVHINEDHKSGREAGFYCEKCQDAVMGLPEDFGKGRLVIE
ncbi:MAG: hypothetical protein RLN86_06840 [Cyclobacteriaceae bacterium]